jgi:hypothetical protein
MSLTAYPSRVAADATSLVIYQGQPRRSVSWLLTGSGTLTPLSTTTDDAGMAAARYTPGTVGDAVTIQVTFGA